jgi:hypothetical protein
MTLRLAKILLSAIVAGLMVVGTSAKAQENVIEVDLNFIKDDSMKIFLQDFRRELQNSRSGLPSIVNEARQDFKTIKQEHTKSVGVTKNFKKPVLLRRKIFPSSKEIAPGPELYQDFGKFFPEKKIFEPQIFRTKEKLLNLNERQYQADTKFASREKLLRARNTDLGQLKIAMTAEPLKSYLKKLTRLSEKIKSLRGQLLEDEGVQRTVFLDLGNTYLESHEYLNTLSLQNRLTIASFAEHSGVALGTHESALWVYKMALVRDPNDGETNFRIGKILSDMGEQDLALRRVRSAEVLFEKNNQPERAVQTQSFIKFLESSSQEN